MATSKKHTSKPNRFLSAELVDSSRAYERDITPIEEKQTAREVASELAREYARRDSVLHATESESLLTASDLFADFQDGTFDREAATSRLEYLLHNSDPQSIEQMHIAQDLLESSISAQTDIATYYRLRLLHHAIPLFMLPNNTDISQKQLEQGLKVRRRSMLRTIQAIDAEISDARNNGNKNTDSLIGVVNEALFLAALTHKNTLNLGLIALPSFYWQDRASSNKVWSSSSDDSKSELPGFDIQLVSMTNTHHLDKIQIKSSHNYDEIKVYEHDIIILSATDYADVIGEIAQIGDSPRAMSLHKRFSGVGPEITGPRIEKLNELVLQEIVQQKKHIAARQPRDDSRHLTHQIQLPDELAANQ
jgi:hypothetical protein